MKKMVRAVLPWAVFAVVVLATAVLMAAAAECQADPMCAGPGGVFSKVPEAFRILLSFL